MSLDKYCIIKSVKNSNEHESLFLFLEHKVILEGLILKLKLQSFGHLMQRADSFEKILMLGKTEGRRRRG